jgi:hypothetical protein
MSDEVYDPYDESNNTGGGGAPVVSWALSRLGDKVTGIVVPPDIESPSKGYKIGREYQDGTDEDSDDKGFLVWPPKNNRQDIKRPVTEAKFARLWPDEPIPTGRGQVTRVEITLQTEYRNAEFLSDSFVKRTKEGEGDPNAITTRRILRSGPDLPEKFDEALKAAGEKAPSVGQRWTVELVDREENKRGKGKTRRHKVTIEPATPETLKIVDAYVTAAMAAAPAQAEPGDPYAGGEPPF